MNKLNEAVASLHEIDGESVVRRKKSKIHPLAVFLVTIAYIGTTGSFGKYEVNGLGGMFLYILAIGIVCDISVFHAAWRMKYVIVLVAFLGTANLFFDRKIVNVVNGVNISQGMISFFTLFLKAVFMFLAVYLMIIRIGMDGVCCGLSVLHVPGIFITMLTLMYRYIIILLREIDRMWTAYHLRSPGQKGINIRVWGSFLGLLLFRSIDRANAVFDSMQLRGYDAVRGIPIDKGDTSLLLSILYVVGWIGIFIILRIYPVFDIVGHILG